MAEIKVKCPYCRSEEINLYAKISNAVAKCKIDFSANSSVIPSRFPT